MRFYPHFILVKDRSPGFASTARNLVALFRLAFATAAELSSLALLRTSKS
jgi:hypothetical protein